MSLFPSNFITQLEYLSLISRRVFRGSLLAQRRTVQQGTGIEFSEHREYSAGDDFRYLDWNIYARLGDLLLKRFQEEQDLTVFLLLDCSRSMGFKSPGNAETAKFNLARQLTAALAYIALADLDRISVLAFADGITEEFPVTRGKAQILPLLRFLERLQPGGRDTHLSTAVQGLLHRRVRRGLAIVVSDLFDPHGFQKGLDQLRHHRFDAHILQLHDPAEANPALLGDVEFVDVEDGSRRQVTVTEKNLRSYQRLFQQHQMDVRNYCRSHELGCTQTNTQVSFDDLILHMMRASRLQR